MNTKSFLALFLSTIYVTIAAQVQTARYVSMTANTNAFYEYLPKNYHSSNKLYPVIIFIHGVKELGSGTTTSLPTILRNGPPKLIHDGTFPDSFTVHQQTFRFVIISPQFIKWPRPNDIEQVIDYVVKHYKVDTNRIYISGISMGGGATWNYASNNPVNAKRVAAIVPISGASTPNIFRARIMANTNLPVWAFHNKIDPVVSPNNSIGFVREINECLPAPNPLAKLTIFNAAGHDSWTAAYNPTYCENGMNVYEWMLQYSRGKANIPIKTDTPIANAGADTSIELPQDSIMLSGKAVTGAAESFTYKWIKISGPNFYQFSNSTIEKPVVKNLTQGTYLFSLIVTDKEGRTDADTVKIIVQPPNYIAIPATIEAENYAGMNGVINEKTSDISGGSDVYFVHKGGLIDYMIHVPAAGDYEMAFRIASETVGGTFQILQSNGFVLTNISFPSSSGHDIWATINITIHLQKGDQKISIFSQQKGWKINWLQFSKTRLKQVKVNLYAGKETYNNPEWNNWNIGVASVKNKQIDSLQYTDGTISTISALLSYSQSVADNGLSYQSGVAPTEVLRFASYSSISRVLNISGLSKQNTYTIELYASRAKPNILTEFTLNGLSDTLNAENNFNNKIVFKNIKPNLSGSMEIKIKGLNVYNYLNGFIINELNSTNTSKQAAAISISDSTKIFAKKNQPTATFTGINIFPNPAHESVSIEFENTYLGNINIRLIDMNGVTKKVESFKKDQPATSVFLNIKNLNSGTYFLLIQTGSQVLSKKIIKL